MKEPTRLMSGSGPARELMHGSALRVPSEAKQRALQFAGAAVGLAASGTAAAAGTVSLAKSLLLTVSLSAVGGAVASLAVSEAFVRSETARTATALVPAPRNPAATNPARGSLPPAAAPAIGTEPESPKQQPIASRSEPPDSAPRALAPSQGKTSASVDADAAAPAPSHQGRVAPRHSSLFEEQSIIEAARAALAQGDSGRAVATLDDYDRRYAQKQFGPEALALRVQALRAAGQHAHARTLAKDFERRYPHHPLLTRVQGTAEAP